MFFLIWPLILDLCHLRLAEKRNVAAVAQPVDTQDSRQLQ